MEESWPTIQSLEVDWYNLLHSRVRHEIFLLCWVCSRTTYVSPPCSFSYRLSRGSPLWCQTIPASLQLWQHFVPRSVSPTNSFGKIIVKLFNYFEGFSDYSDLLELSGNSSRFFWDFQGVGIMNCLRFLGFSRDFSQITM